MSGTGFTTIIPAQPSETQLWDTSTLLTNGRIRVVNKEKALGIESLNSDACNDRDSTYDLSGRKVSSSAKGIVIKNGNVYFLSGK